MRKTWICFLALTLVFSMSACSPVGAGSKAEETSVATESEENTTVAETSVAETTAATIQETQIPQEELDRIPLPMINQYAIYVEQAENADELTDVSKKAIWYAMNGSIDSFYEGILEKENNESISMVLNNMPVLNAYGEALAAVPEGSWDKICQIAAKAASENTAHTEANFLNYVGSIILGKAGNGEEITDLDSFKDIYGTYYDWAYSEYIMKVRDGITETDPDMEAIDAALEELYAIVK